MSRKVREEGEEILPMKKILEEILPTSDFFGRP